jgi:hypothetical protein
MQTERTIFIGKAERKIILKWILSGVRACSGLKWVIGELFVIYIFGPTVDPSFSDM